MALFLQKPIFWNDNNYLKPSGASATSGFPQQRGYGHEEWNNSSRLRITRSGQKFRVFHTEQMGKALLSQNLGQTFVFMMASHHGIQQLVGVAANAVGMMGDSYKKQRVEIAKELRLGELWSDAWDIPLVRAKHENSVSDFKTHWKQDLHWIPNWICPDDYYLWLTEPITLDPKSLVGKDRFLSMFGSYTALNQQTAIRFIESIPEVQRDKKWARIFDAICSAPTEFVSEDEANQKNSITDALTLVNARRGQGRFRDELMNIWERACAVTGLDCPAALKASHIKPWSKSTDRERLDRNNGLILSANIDALFDAGLVTFEDNGEMRISKLLSVKNRDYIGIPASLRRKPTIEICRYLEHHRTKEFFPG